MNIANKMSTYEPNNDFVPLKIEFKMCAPVVLAHPWISFDGLVAHLLIRKILNEEYRSLPSKFPLDVSTLKLPLKRFSKKKISFHHASISIFDKNDFSVTKIYKRFHSKEVDKVTKSRIKKIRLGQGKFKGFMMSLPYISPQKVTFFANGNKKEIFSLLQGLPGLGKKVAIGYGFFKKVKVLEIPKDLSIFKGNLAMRPIPIEILKGYTKKMMLTYTFPYWDRRNIELCAIPNSEVVL